MAGLLGWVVIDEGLFDEESGKALLYFGGAGAVFVWISCRYFGGLAKQGYDPSISVKRVAGTIRVEGKKGGPKFFRIDDIPIHVPRHWHRYLADGDVVEAEIYPNPHRSYLLATTEGLSISCERNRGWTEVAGHQPSRMTAIIIGFVPLMIFVSSVLFNLGVGADPSIPTAQTLPAFFDQVVEWVPLAVFIVSTPLSVWMLLRHWRGVHQIHQYYEEGGRPDAEALAVTRATTASMDGSLGQRRAALGMRRCVRRSFGMGK